MALLLAPYIMHGSGSSWTPSDDASLFAWYDASDEATITDTGGSVTNWADKEGSADLALGQGTPETGNATYDENGLNTIYGTADERLEGTITFPSSGSFMITIGTSVITSAGGLRAMLSLNDGSATLNYYSSDSGGGFKALINTSLATNFGDGATFYSGGGFKIHQIVFDAANDTAALYIDDSLIDSVTDYTTNYGTSVTFKWNASTGNAEIEQNTGEITFTEAVDATTRGQHHDYMAAKWIA